MPGTLYTYRYLLEHNVGRSRIRDGTLRRVARGVYLSGDAEGPTVDLKALFLRLPDDVLLSHQSAAHAFGFGEHPERVHLLVPAGLPRPEIAGVTTHEAVVPVPDPVTVDGIPAVPPERAAVDVAKGARRLDAIAVLDAVLHAMACTAADLAAEAARHAGLRGIRQVRALVPFADGRAECAQESHLRLVLADGGLPAFEPQFWVCDEAGAGRYRIDLACAGRKVGLEYDGVSHLDPRRLGADRVRMNWLSANGWTMRYFTAKELYGDRIRLLAAVQAALLEGRQVG